MAFYYYGVRAILVAGASCFASVFSDYIACCARRKKYDWGDLSPIMSGLLFALLMPASVPYSVVAFGSVFMSLICKNAFGGNKNLIFCPVCITYIFTAFCFPSYVLRYPSPVPFGKLPLTNTVTDGLGYSYTHALDNGAASAFSLLDIIWGKLAGPMGSMTALIILIAGVALYFFGDIPSAALFAGFGTNVLINVIYPVGEAGWYAVLNSLVAGSYLFVLVFMACDPRYVPKRMFSQIVYGVLFALGSFYIRKYTNIENAAIFTLPLLCIFRDEFDRLTDSLEKLLKFILKNLKTAVSFIIRKSGDILDRFSEFIAVKIVEGKKMIKEKAAAKKAEKENKAEDEQKSENSETSENEQENMPEDGGEDHMTEQEPPKKEESDIDDKG